VGFCFTSEEELNATRSGHGAQNYLLCQRKATGIEKRLGEGRRLLVESDCLSGTDQIYFSKLINIAIVSGEPGSNGKL